MLILTLYGVLALVFGILVIIAPELIRNWSKRCDIIIMAVDEKIKSHKASIGIVSIASGIVALFLAYYFRVKYFM